MTVHAEVQAPVEEPRTPDPRLDLLILLAGVVVSVLATVVTAVAELYLSPLRIGGIPIGVAILFAAAANWGLAWFTVTTTRRRWPLALPWALWTAIMVFASGVRTAEGDYLIGADYVALVMILVGSLSFAVYAYRMILARPQL